METFIPIMVFGSSFLFLIVWIFASRKGKGCCGSEDKDHEECKPCSTEKKSEKGEA
jgi:hypothetical protein